MLASRRSLVRASSAAFWSFGGPGMLCVESIDISRFCVEATGHHRVTGERRNGGDVGPGFGRRGPRPAPVRLTSTRAPMALDRLCRQCRQSFSADHQLINRAVASKAALLPSKPPIAGLTALRIQAVPRKMLSSSIAAL